MVVSHKGGDDKSLEYLSKALEICGRTLRTDDLIVAVTHNSIGELHLRRGHRASAFRSFEKALNIRKQAFGNDNFKVATALKTSVKERRNSSRLSNAIGRHSVCDASRIKSCRMREMFYHVQSSNDGLSSGSLPHQWINRKAMNRA